MMRFHRQLHTVRDLFAEQSIGDIRFVRAVFSIDMQRAGDIRFDPEIGGGCLWDLGSYPVSFTRAVLQEDPIEANASQVLSDTALTSSSLANCGFRRERSCSLSRRSRDYPTRKYRFLERVAPSNLINPTQPTVGRMVTCESRAKSIDPTPRLSGTLLSWTSRH